MKEREALRELVDAIRYALTGRLDFIQANVVLGTANGKSLIYAMIAADNVAADSDVSKATNELVDALNTVKMTEPMCDYWDEMMATPEGKRLEAAMVAVTQGGGDDKRVWGITVYRCNPRIDDEKTFVGEFQFEITQADIGTRVENDYRTTSYVVRGTDIRDCVVIGGTEYLVERHESGTPTVTIHHDNPWQPPSQESRLIEALRQIAINAADYGSFDVIQKIADDAIGGEA